LKEKLKFARKIVLDKKAISVAVSSVILTTVVVVLGFVLLSWTYGKSLTMNTEYNEAVDSNVAKLKEKIVFEYLFYNKSKNELSAYLLNCGKSNNVSIVNVFIKNGTWFKVFPRPKLRFLNGTSTESLDINEEGYFALNVNLQTGVTYSIRIITERGRIFETTFVA